MHAPLRGAPADQRTARLFSMKYYVIEIHPSDCITPSPPPVRVSAYFNILSRKDYESEIKRVRRLLLSYEGLQSSIGGPLTEEELKDIGKTDAVSTTNKGEPTEEEKELSAAYQALYKAQAEPSKTPESAAALKEAQVRLQEALDKQGQANLQKNKDNVRDMDNMGRKEKRLWISKMIGDAKDQIDLLQKGLDRLSKSSIAVPAIQEVSKSESDGKELMTTNYSTADERWADPRFKLPRDGAAPPAPPKEDDKPSPWTKINVSISASSSESNKESQSSSSSVSASVSVGLFSASGGFNYSQASSKASESAASCNVDISFDAMLVTINRAWLHGELFADPELNVAPDVALSPGPSELHRFINNKEQKPLEKFSYFPSYPTSFVIASNVELEFRGDTTHLEQAVESSHFDANLKVGYGPFSLSASHSQDKSSSKTKMETTATGTRIKIEAPSIIGWVTTMLPKLPREKESNSLVQAFF
ncbi:hypothetical protein FOPG_18115 [Fusarium oxysporum f. sp. conglutinans race 2 54008]|uniref:Uncharacterized protein n=1 Tax=Fusarium oxysporum f. sp. conglutinans race 2 54008 TaxID=1089457 RepID=X0GPV4_FUSOX|nr:hypothetical protein FOPG_18115 [Fusarium oxysporum f. sp. conglutinans race 2 54008]